MKKTISVLAATLMLAGAGLAPAMTNSPVLDTAAISASAATTLSKVAIKGNYSHSQTQIKINWNKVTGAKGYRVYRYNAATKQWDTVATLSGVNTLSYTDSGLVPGTTYNYKVKAYDNSGSKTVWGVASSTLKASTKAIDKVAIQSEYSRTVSSITINWSKAENATGYRVYRYNAETKAWESIATLKNGSTLTYTDSNLTPASTYRYKVKAYRNINSKTYWGVASGMLTTQTSSVSLSKPQITSSTASDSFITLNWSKCDNATGYRVYRLDAATNEWKAVATLSGADKLTYTDSGLNESTEYNYRVKAYRNISGKTYWSGDSATLTANTISFETKLANYIDENNVEFASLLKSNTNLFASYFTKFDKIESILKANNEYIAHQVTIRLGSTEKGLISTAIDFDLL